MIKETIEIWADSFHEGEWCCDNITRYAEEKGCSCSKTYEYGFMPVYIIKNTEYEIKFEVYGSYFDWTNIPESIKNLINMGKPDFIAYSDSRKEIIFAVEETSATMTGNQPMQRCERQYGSAKEKIPFWYLVSEYGNHLDGGVRRDSIWPTISALKLSEGKGIAYSNNPVSRQTHVAKSSQSYLKDFVERFDRLYENSSGQDPEHAKQDLIENLLKPNAGNKGHADNSQEEVPRHRTLEGFIKTYSLEDLQDIAEDIGYKTSEKDSKKLAKEIAAKLLTEETMKEQLFFATEDDLDTFEEIIKEKGRIVDDADFDRYENIYELNYYIAYDDGYVGVTDDIIRAYEKIGGKNYREVHRQARWLYDCLRYTAYIYVILPVRQLYRIFKQKKGMDIGMDKFLSLFDGIPADHNPCVTIDNKVIYKEVVKNDLYKDLEKKIADVGYYVPTPDNITVFLKDYYPADDPAYKKLHDYYANDLKWGEDNATEMCHVAARMFPMNGDISDYVDTLKKSGLILRKHEDVEKFSKLIIDVHNNTRMFDFRGHTPEEMTRLYPRDIETEIPTIVPMSTEAANILDADRKAFEKMGIKIDTESNAAKLKTAVFPQGPTGNVIQMTKKVYPNDPCPCGSGKKYKKCCGAK